MMTALPPRGTLPGSAYTRDNGATWTAIDYVHHGKAAFVSPRVGWSSSTPDTIYKWTGDLLDPSVEWTSQSSGIPTNDQVVLAAVNENVCWGATRVPGAAWVTRTTNGGTNWTASNLTSFNTIGSIEAVSADTAWIGAIGAIYNTIDGGVNWTQQLATGPKQIVRFFDSNNGVCIGNGTGVNAEIYTTTNGGTAWTLVPSLNIPDLQSENFIPANSWVVGNTI